MAEGIILGGILTPVIASDGERLRVHAWCDPPGSGPRVPEFRAGDGFNRGRTHPIDLVVHHWTGGEGEPDRMAETLRKRKLGVEFAVGRTGTIWQFCDPAYVDTADAGIVNHRSVGVEVVCYGFAAGWTFDPVRAMRLPVVPKLGRDRETYLATTHGRTVRTAKLYGVQLRSCLALADALSVAIGIPRAVAPGDSVHLPLLRRDDARFRGHCGHYHLTVAKRDPGPWYMEQLSQHFARGGAS